MKHMILAAALSLSLAGCGLTNPVKTAHGDYYALDARVTAADAGVLSFVNQCKAQPVMPVCTKENYERLAQATTALGTAMDGYSAAVKDPNSAGTTLQRASAIVTAALTTVEALLVQFGVHTQ